MDIAQSTSSTEKLPRSFSKGFNRAKFGRRQAVQNHMVVRFPKKLLQFRQAAGVGLEPQRI